MDNLMTTLDPKTLQHLARRTLTEMVKESGDIITLSGDKGGKEMTVAVGKPSSAEPCNLTTDEIVKIQLEAKLTDR